MTQRFILVATLFVALTTAGFAQAEWQTQPATPRQVEQRSKLELSAQTGYSFGSYIRTYDGDLTLNGSIWYGGAIDYLFRKDIAFEVSYSYRKGSMDFDPYYAYDWSASELAQFGDISTHFIQLGTIKTFRKNNVAPFIGGNLGMVIYSPENQIYDTNVFFAVSGLGGAKIYLNDKFGIRLQGRLYLPIYFANLTFYCGGGGCGTGAGGSGTLEGELSGGLFFAF